MTDEPVFDSPAVMASRAAARARRRAAVWRTDFFLDGQARLDERTRILVEATFAGICSDVEAAISRDAVRILSDRGHAAAAARLVALPHEVTTLAARPWAISDELIEELTLRCRHDTLADALPIAVGEPDAPSLLVRLSAEPRAEIGRAAAALLVAENRRRSASGASELAAELHYRLVWLVAAALLLAGDPSDLVTGRALAEAAERSIAIHDEGERLEAVASRLAAAIDAGPDALPGLLIDTLGDRRLSLFCAMVAHALAIDISEVRALVVEPEDTRLWLALRGAGLDRSDIARIAVILAEADPRRDLDLFADRLDAIAGVTPEVARSGLAPLALPPGFRSALREVERRRR